MLSTPSVPATRRFAPRHPVDVEGGRERQLPVSTAAPLPLHRDRRLAAEERDEAPLGGAGAAHEVPGAGAGDREPAGGRPGLPGEELGEDADVGAEPERLAPGPLEGGPDVAQQDAPALAAVPRAVLAVRGEEVVADGGRDERQEPIALEDRGGVAPRWRSAERRTRGDEVPPVVAEVRQDEGDDVRRAGRGREAASLDAREGAPHDVDVGDRRPGGREERDGPGLVREGNRLRPEGP